jgi:hypothetical protein
MSTTWKHLGVLALTTLIGGVKPAVSDPIGDGAVASPTFTKDVAPIFQDKCEACHRPDSMAPMSLVTYEETRPWVRAIRLRVSLREMPPWHIDKAVGIQHFKNDRSLSDDQIDTVLRWIDGGAPKGDPKDMPRPKQWPDVSVWNFAQLFGGPPDLIMRSPSFTVLQQAQDKWLKSISDTGLTEERWVRAIEIRPLTVKGRRVVHHAIAYLQQDEGPSANNGLGPGVFMEWAVGKQGELLRPDSGRLLLPGSKIQWELHLHAVGEEISDSVELGIYFYPKGQKPRYREVLNGLLASNGASLDLPPNQITVSQNFTVMQSAGRIENFQAHMHLRGKAMSMEAILPDGSKQTLSYVNNFDFQWMNNYVYADEAAPLLPKGTVLRITAWHDNTAANKNNPDPNQWVGWGDRTVDEMAHAWVNIAYMSDEDFKMERAKRKAAESNGAQAVER